MRPFDYVCLSTEIRLQPYSVRINNLAYVYEHSLYTVYSPIKNICLSCKERGKYMK